MIRVEVSFFYGEVRVDGVAAALPEKELELLFTIAAVGTINGEQLMDILWPETDGDAAHNAFRVCLHRLRKHLRAGGLVLREGKAYSLDGAIDVDLYRLRELTASCTGPAAPMDPRLDALLAQIRSGHTSRAKLGPWFDPFERLLWTLAQRCHMCRASDLVTAP